MSLVFYMVLLCPLCVSIQIIIIIIMIYYIYIALNTTFLSALQINVLLPRLCQCFPHIEVHMANKE